MDGEDVIDLDEYISIVTHWIALSVNGNNRTASYDTIYFYSFGVDPIPKETKKFIGNKNIITKSIEYKHTIRYCEDNFALNLLTLC